MVNLSVFVFWELLEAKRIACDHREPRCSKPPTLWLEIKTCKSDFNTGALWWTQRTPFRLGSLCHRFARREAVASVPKGRSYSQFLAAKAASEKPSQATVRVGSACGLSLIEGASIGSPVPNMEPKVGFPQNQFPLKGVLPCWRVGGVGAGELSMVAINEGQL